ncbi:MAG: hypothetical protein UY29_C0016G0025 [Parcubacteria group bacterium GW2011_GWC2_48_17]|nr:MAG: hypothetical protein UY29_C0016G0025 [Parcubacteria group bacterium GW2011_GWC2_48_17]
MKRLSCQDKSRIFEKIVHQHGRLFLVRFVILEREGRLRGKIISCEPIGVLSDTGAAKEKYLLPISFSAKDAPEGKLCFKRIVSPFSKLEFFISQMPRAPSFS